MWVKSWLTTNGSRFPTCGICRRKVREAKVFEWIIAAIALIMIVVQWIYSDHCGSFGINCRFHNWLSVVTSGGWISQNVVPHYDLDWLDSDGWSSTFAINRKSREDISGIENLNWRWLCSREFCGKKSSSVFFKKPLFWNPNFFFPYCTAMSSSFLFIRWRKEK